MYRNKETMRCINVFVPDLKSNVYKSLIFTNAYQYTHTHKADNLSRTGPSSSSSFIHQRSTLRPAHPIEQTFILSILQFPPQSFLSSSLWAFLYAECRPCWFHKPVLVAGILWSGQIVLREDIGVTEYMPAWTVLCINGRDGVMCFSLCPLKLLFWALKTL